MSVSGGLAEGGMGEMGLSPDFDYSPNRTMPFVGIVSF